MTSPAVQPPPGHATAGRTTSSFSADFQGASRARRRAPLVAAAVVVFLLVVRPSPAPAGLEEMYRNFPPTDRECSDPVAGTWVGHAIWQGNRYRITMEIARDEERHLTGTIDAEYWEADFDEPPPCQNDDHYHTIIRMPSRGQAEEREVTFVGQSWERKAHYCGIPHDYIPDAFSGSLASGAPNVLFARWYAVYGPWTTREEMLRDPSTREIVDVEFRRTHCEEAPPQPVPTLPSNTPPPKTIDRCGCF